MTKTPTPGSHAVNTAPVGFIAQASIDSLSEHLDAAKVFLTKEGLLDYFPKATPVALYAQPSRECLQQSAEITDAEIDRIAESMPGGLDGFLKAWGWRQFARAILQAAPPAPAAVAVPAEILDALGMTGGEVDDVVVRIQDMSAARHDAEEARDELATTPAQEHATQLAGQGQALPVYELNVRGVFQDCTPLVSAFSLPDGKHQLYLAAAPVQAQEDARDADGWYLQDTRSYVGNDVLFWAQDSNGYTTDVSKAHVFTQEEAFRQAAMRGVDRAWPKAYIDGKTRPAVDMQYIKHEDAIAARAAQGGA